MEQDRRYSVGEAAKAVGATRETLRHYDRIGLVKPTYRDKESGYRLYSPDDLVRLSTVLALRGLNLSTEKSLAILNLQDLSQVAALLREAKQRNDEQIEDLLACRDRIERALAHYERLQAEAAAHQPEAVLRDMEPRVILLAGADLKPTLESLWGYLRHFKAQLGEDKCREYLFRDTAGIFLGPNGDRMFAECLKYGSRGPLWRIPGGQYQCRQCPQDQLTAALSCLDAQEGHEQPDFSIATVVLDGVLRWHYELQTPAQGQRAVRLA